MKTIVIGHRNPDMDAICSALAYAEFKRATGTADVMAARCGNTNERIDYALRRFGFEAPVFCSDVQPRIEDVMERDVVCAHVDSPVYEAITRIGEKKFRGLPVVDDARRCVGLVSSFKLGQYLFPPLDKIASTRVVNASLEDIRAATHGTLLAGSQDLSVRPHHLVVAAMHTTTFQKRLGELDLASTVLIVGDRWNIQQLSIEAGVRALLITNNFPARPAVLEAAKKCGVVVISSPYDTATTVLLARSAVAASQMLDSDFTSLPDDMPLREARADVAMSAQFAFPVLDTHGCMVGILSKSDLLKPVPRQLILVDHNELTQAVHGADEIPIVEILDHHRIGVAPTHQPILFLNRPVGSTCTIVASCYQQADVPIPPNVAGILMCGLISDTLNLTSPTTTETDRRIMDELSALAGVKPADLAGEIFSVGSPLLTLTAPEVITADCKEYVERGIRFSVSQIEELSFSQLADKQQGLIDELEKYRASHGYFFSALLVTDVNTQNSILLVRGSESITRLIDYPDVAPFAWDLEGVVSRKKQLLPYLTNLIARAA
ncbi:MAG: putative manganese-dependent inorganic diphosphatase [Terrimicrobiaceae bacterium]|nr:putative manganese-dependent inorganic diphosphatase [Terrimicrobiaceae bacterium]